MTTPTVDKEVLPSESPVKRILIAIGGVILLAVGALITLGTELVGIAAILVAWFLMRRRQRRLTRAKAWFVSVGATAVPLLIFFVVSLISAPKLTPEQRQKNVAAARARSRDSMPEFLKKIVPQQQRQTTAAADSIASRLLENKGFMVWMAAMGALIASGMVALFAGTIAWGATMMLFRAATDEWMGAVGPPQAVATGE